MKIIETRAGKKVFNYIEDFIRSEYFQNGIKELRSRYGIPEHGYAVKSIDLKPLDGLFYKPKGFEIEKDQYTDLLRNLNALKRKRIEIENIWISSILLCYFFHDTIPDEFYNNLVFSIDESNLCEIEDRMMMLNEVPPNYLLAYIKDVVVRRPVVIALRPEVGQRDIIDYVKKNWHKIAYLQSKYIKSKKLGKLKTRQEQNRKLYDFIYQNRALKPKEIMTILKKNNFEIIDEGHISKIISLENKRRKEV